MELIFKELESIFWAGFGKKVAGDGDPRLGHSQTQLWVSRHRWFLSLPEQVGGEFVGAVIVAGAEDFFF